MRIAFVTLPVGDQDRAKQFYVDALGWTCTYDVVGPNGRWIDLMPPGGGTAIALIPQTPQPVPGLVLHVDDLDRTYEALSARGVTFTSPPADKGWGRFASFNDPDGHTWVMMPTP